MRKLIISIILAAFLAQSMATGYAQHGPVPEAVLPEPGTMAGASASFRPPLLTGMRIDTSDPFSFNFIMHTGDVDPGSFAMDEEAGRLIRYFMASLAVPDEDLWVNLSPYEKERIVPDAFGVTEMGRDLLAQDYLLKQVTASLLYPEGETGRAFWAEVYSRAQAQFGTTDIPTDTFNKVWIVPDKAAVYAEGDRVVVTEARLKVMLESDYLAMEHHAASAAALGDSSARQEMAEQVMRSVIIPVLEQEVNGGRNFARLRQVYYALILARWYKDNLKQSILTRRYADQNKVQGIAAVDKSDLEKIYARYVDAFRKGAFNYIRDEVDPVSRETVARQYFSGGVNFLELNIDAAEQQPAADAAPARQFDIKAKLEPAERRGLPVEKMADWHPWREGNSQATHGTLYRNADGARILKILNKVKGVNDEHVMEFYRTIKELPEKLKAYGYAGPVKVDVPELVRTDDGRLALRRDFRKGIVLQYLIDFRLSDMDGGSYLQFGEYPSNEEFRRITDEFLDAVDAVTGGKADRRTSEGFTNFLLAEAPGYGHEILNIDPISVRAVVKGMAAARRSLWASIKGALARPQAPPRVIEGGDLPAVDMKDWKLWFWPNLRAGQSRIYISRDGKQVLKVFRLKGLREEHVQEIQAVIARLPQDLKDKGYRGPVEVVVPRLVRVRDDGLGLLMEKKDGFMFETTARRGLSVHDRKALQGIAEEFFAFVDDIAGEGMADRRGVEPMGDTEGEVHYWNFIWEKDAEGRERIYNIDPIDMVVLMERAAKRAEAAPGGIDLNGNNMGLRTEGSGAAFVFPGDIADPDGAGLDGLSPVIISITPAAGMPALQAAR